MLFFWVLLNTHLRRSLAVLHSLAQPALREDARTTWKMLRPLAVLTALSALVSARDVVVDLGYAPYRGEALSNGVAQWLGIRYAAPPVGSLRFAAPQDPEDEHEIQDATQVRISL